MRLIDADNFNSLPHTEVDDKAEKSHRNDSNFNSLPHTEVDQIWC